MCSKLYLCLLLHVFYSATVKAFPTSPPLAQLAEPDPDPDLRNRADAHFVTIYGLYENSFHTPTVDSSKPKLAPVTEAFKAMTRALATPTTTGSGSRSVMSSATPTPLYKATPPLLGPGLASLPTLTQSSIASSPTDSSQETAESLQSAAQIRSHRLVVFGSIIAGLICSCLLLFLFLDPRVIRKLRGIKVDHKSQLPSKRFFGRPKPKWDIAPISSSDFAFMNGASEKPIIVIKNLDNEKHPISRFSICSSVYPPSSQSSSESERGFDMPRSQTSPVRPPRPPTADSPTLSDSVYFACADQPYIIVAPQPFTDIDRGLDRHPDIPTGPKIFSCDLANMYACPNGWNIKSTHMQPNSNPVPEFNDTRHSRSYSAPSFVGSMSEQVSNRPGPAAVQRLLKHRKSRSASGWAYPARPSLEGLPE